MASTTTRHSAAARSKRSRASVENQDGEVTSHWKSPTRSHVVTADKWHPYSGDSSHRLGTRVLDEYFTSMPVPRRFVTLDSWPMDTYISQSDRVAQRLYDSDTKGGAQLHVTNCQLFISHPSLSPEERREMRKGLAALMRQQGSGEDILHHAATCMDEVSVLFIGNHMKRSDSHLALVVGTLDSMQTSAVDNVYHEPGSAAAEGTGETLHREDLAPRLVILGLCAFHEESMSSRAVAARLQRTGDALHWTRGADERAYRHCFAWDAEERRGVLRAMGRVGEIHLLCSNARLGGFVLSSVTNWLREVMECTHAYLDALPSVVPFYHKEGFALYDPKRGLAHVPLGEPRGTWRERIESLMRVAERHTQTDTLAMVKSLVGGAVPSLTPPHAY